MNWFKKKFGYKYWVACSRSIDLITIIKSRRKPRSFYQDFSCYDIKDIPEILNNYRFFGLDPKDITYLYIGVPYQEREEFACKKTGLISEEIELGDEGLIPGSHYYVRKEVKHDYGSYKLRYFDKKKVIFVSLDNKITLKVQRNKIKKITCIEIGQNKYLSITIKY